MLKVKYTVLAKSDLRDIADYIESEADAATAMRAIQNITTHVRTLARDGQRWSRLSEQIFRFDKWSLYRG